MSEKIFDFNAIDRHCCPFLMMQHAMLNNLNPKPPTFILILTEKNFHALPVEKEMRTPACL
jgi:hypothetical protein